MSLPGTTLKPNIIRTPDQRLRVFVSSTLQELAPERLSARQAIEQLHLAPVMFEIGARPHPPRDLYRAYLEQSHIFIGIYWQRYGWIAPDMTISGLEDEYNLSGNKPKLIYIKSPAPDREAGLVQLLERLKNDRASYKYFSTPEELRESIENDLAMLLTESFEATRIEPVVTIEQLAAVSNNLPVSPTPLIGREHELAALQFLLSDAEYNLITLTGPGGTGKTRLAVQAAADVLDSFPGGVFFVPLAAVFDPQQIPHAIASALNLHESFSGTSIWESVKHYLDDKRTLLVLDNFEQIVAAAPLVFELLQACPQIKVLVTSRSVLHLRGEREFPVRPLALPNRSHLPPLPKLSQYAAVQLFIQRASDVKPSFTITNENAPAVAEICHRLDGLPLAIELAAARSRVLTPQAMLTRLEQRLPLLSGSLRDLPDRQQTLRSTIDWSFNLLDEQARLLLRRVSVFVEGWTLEAAEAICQCADDQPWDVLTSMEVLSDNSLLVRRQLPDGEIRFVLLGTIRDYAQDKLAEAGEMALLRQRHFDYFFQLAERAEIGLRGPEQKHWIQCLDLEADNLRAALEWMSTPEAAANSLGPAALRLVSALAWYWFVRGRWTEGREWFRRALELGREAPPQHIAAALTHASLYAWFLGDFVAARTQVSTAVILSQQAECMPELAQALASKAAIILQDDVTAASSLAQESAVLSETLGDKWSLAFALHVRGSAELLRSDLAAAQSLLERSIALYHELGDRWRAADPISRLGDIKQRRGDYAAAQALYQDSLTAARELDDRSGIAARLSSLAEVAYAQGDYGHARKWYEDSLALREDLNDKLNSAWLRYGLGKVAWVTGDLKAAEKFMTECLQVVQAAGDRGGLAWLYQHLGHVALQLGVTDLAQQTGHFWQARHRFREALQLARLEGHGVTIAFTVLGCAGLAAANAKPETAARLWEGSRALKAANHSMMSAIDQVEYQRLADFVQQHWALTTPAESATADLPMTSDQLAEIALNDL